VETVVKQNVISRLCNTLDATAFLKAERDRRIVAKLVNHVKKIWGEFSEAGSMSTCLSGFNIDLLPPVQFSSLFRFTASELRQLLHPLRLLGRDGLPRKFILGTLLAPDEGQWEVRADVALMIVLYRLTRNASMEEIAWYFNLTVSKCSAAFDALVRYLMTYHEEPVQEVYCMARRFQSIADYMVELGSPYDNLLGFVDTAYTNCYTPKPGSQGVSELNGNKPLAGFNCLVFTLGNGLLVLSKPCTSNRSEDLMFQTSGVADDLNLVEEGQKIHYLFYGTNRFTMQLHLQRAIVPPVNDKEFTLNFTMSKLRKPFDKIYTDFQDKWPGVQACTERADVFRVAILLHNCWTILQGKDHLDLNGKRSKYSDGMKLTLKQYLVERFDPW